MSNYKFGMLGMSTAITDRTLATIYSENSAPTANKSPVEMTKQMADSWEFASKIIAGQMPIIMTEIMLNRRYSFIVDNVVFKLMVTGGGATSIHFALETEFGGKVNSSFRSVDATMLGTTSLASIFKSILPAMMTEIVVLINMEAS